MPALPNGQYQNPLRALQTSQLKSTTSLDPFQVTDRREDREKAEAVQGADNTGSHDRARGLSEDGVTQGRRRVADRLQCFALWDPY